MARSWLVVHRSSSGNSLATMRRACSWLASASSVTIRRTLGRSTRPASIAVCRSGSRSTHPSATSASAAPAYSVQVSAMEISVPTNGFGSACRSGGESGSHGGA